MAGLIWLLLPARLAPWDGWVGREAVCVADGRLQEAQKGAAPSEVTGDGMWTNSRLVGTVSGVKTTFTTSKQSQQDKLHLNEHTRLLEMQHTLQGQAFGTCRCLDLQDQKGGGRCRPCAPNLVRVWRTLILPSSHLLLAMSSMQAGRSYTSFMHIARKWARRWS